MVAFRDRFGRLYEYSLKMCSILFARQYDEQWQPLKEYRTGTLDRLIGELNVIFHLGFQYSYKHIVYVYLSCLSSMFILGFNGG